MNNHGICSSTLRVVGSVNTQHCALLKHYIASGAHIEFI